MHISKRFEHLLDVYRRSDGGRWGGQALQDATGGVVTRSYVSNLLKGRIESPGYDKLAATAKAMGFSPAEWFAEDLAGWKVPDGLHEELVEALQDRTVINVVRELSRLPERDRRLVLGIVRQFSEAGA